MKIAAAGAARPIGTTLSERNGKVSWAHGAAPRTRDPRTRMRTVATARTTARTWGRRTKGRNTARSTAGPGREVGRHPTAATAPNRGVGPSKADRPATGSTAKVGTAPPARAMASRATAGTRAKAHTAKGRWGTARATEASPPRAEEVGEAGAVEVSGRRRGAPGVMSP